MPLAAAIIPAVIGAGTALYSANAANKAQDKAISAQNAATQESIAAQQAALDRITQLNQPFINAGQSALGPLAARVGTGAPNFSAPSYARPLPGGTPAPANSNAGLMDRANGTVTQAANETPQAPAPQPAAPQASGPDWDAYIAANPDVAAWIQSGHGDPNLGPNQTPEQAAAYQYHNTGQSEGRALPMTQATPASTTPQAPPQPLDLGTASPVVANFSRPDQGSSPSASQFIDPSKFTTDPGYEWRLQQGQRNLNANFGARGLLQSGSALEGAINYGQNAASAEYQNWFNRQQQLYQDAANQFNTDRNNTNQNFEQDRSYGTNLAINNRDFANSQYNTQTQNMFQLAGIGANAAAAIGGANNNYANNAANLFTNQGNNAATNALAQGSTSSQLANTLGGIATNLFSAPPRNYIPVGNSPASPSYAFPTSSSLAGMW